MDFHLSSKAHIEEEAARSLEQFFLFIKLLKLF